MSQPTDKPISMEHFRALEAQFKWESGHGRREKQRAKRDRRHKTNEAIMEAKARELGVPCAIAYPETRHPLPFRVHAFDVSPEVVLQVDLNGHYAYVTLARHGAFRGRFTPEEIHLLIEQLRAVRLPYREPHVSKGKKAARRG